MSHDQCSLVLSAEALVAEARAATPSAGDTPEEKS